MNASVVLVTGGSRGLGRAATVRLAQRGLRVVLTSRSEDRARAAAAQIATMTGGDVTGSALDLSDLAAVRAFAAAFTQQHPWLKILIANAATKPSPRRTVTPEGHEQVFATDHTGHAVLALGLLPALRAAAERHGDARLVVVSSRLHHPSAPGPRTRLDLHDLDLAHGYRPLRAYKNAKLANLLFTYEFERRHGGGGLHAHALCPGFVPATIADDSTGVVRFAYRHLLSRLPFARTLDDAVDSYEHVALAAELRGTGGCFYVDCRPARSSPESYDRDLAARLWQATLARGALLE